MGPYFPTHMYTHAHRHTHTAQHNSSHLRPRGLLSITAIMHGLHLRQAREMTAYGGRKGCMHRGTSCQLGARGVRRQRGGGVLCYDLLYHLNHWSTACACIH